MLEHFFFLILKTSLQEKKNRAFLKCKMNFVQEVPEHDVYVKICSDSFEQCY